MSKRLTSFNGPSTPTSSPVKPQSKPSTPSQQGPKDSETAFHRRLRTTLLEIRSVALTWNDLVLRDGLGAAKALLDTRTDLSNVLAGFKQGMSPRTVVVGPRLEKMDEYSAELQAILAKLKTCFTRLVSLVDSLEAIFRDAIRQKGYTWTTEPLWFTWSLQSFVDNVPSVVVYYHRSLESYTHLVKDIDDDALQFDKARSLIQSWAFQPHLSEGGWMAEWEELCGIEVGRWEVKV